MTLVRESIEPAKGSEELLTGIPAKEPWIWFGLLSLLPNCQKPCQISDEIGIIMATKNKVQTIYIYIYIHLCLTCMYDLFGTIYIFFTVLPINHGMLCDKHYTFLHGYEIISPLQVDDGEQLTSWRICFLILHGLSCFAHKTHRDSPVNFSDDSDVCFLWSHIRCYVIENVTIKTYTIYTVYNLFILSVLHCAQRCKVTEGSTTPKPRCRGNRGDHLMNPIST